MFNKADSTTEQDSTRFYTVRMVALAFLCVFAGNFGQSFFISWFSAPIKESLALSSAIYGSIYSTATLVSAFFVLLLGGLIDRIAVRSFLNLVLIGLVAACFILGNATNAYLLFVGFLLVRLFGQALLPHTGITIVAKSFEEKRGSFLSYAGMGIPAGEVLLPLAAVAALAILSWQQSFFYIAVLVLVLLLPIANVLLPRETLWINGVSTEGESGKTFSALSQGPSNSALSEDRHSAVKGRIFALKDRRFWFALPALIVAAFIITGIFIHQDFFLIHERWSKKMLASSFVAYGFMHGFGTLLGGRLIDRFSARQLFPYVPVPLLCSMLGLLFFNGWTSLLMMMAGFAICIGIGSSITAALWAEVYGTARIGSIRSMVTSFAVWATAASPVLYGAYIDSMVSITKSVSAHSDQGDATSYLIFISINAAACVLSVAAARFSYR